MAAIDGGKKRRKSSKKKKGGCGCDATGGKRRSRK